MTKAEKNKSYQPGDIIPVGPVEVATANGRVLGIAKLQNMGELTARSWLYRSGLLGLKGRRICVGQSIDEREASENDMHTSMA